MKLRVGKFLIFKVDASLNYIFHYFAIRKYLLMSAVLVPFSLNLYTGNNLVFSLVPFSLNFYTGYNLEFPIFRNIPQKILLRVISW